MQAVFYFLWHFHLVAFPFIRFSFLDNHDYDFDDEADPVFEVKSKHASSSSLKEPLASSPKVLPQVFDDSPTFQSKFKSGSPIFSRAIFNSSNRGQDGVTAHGSSPLLNHSVGGSDSKPEHSSPFTGSPIIFRKDFLKGSSSPGPEARFRF